MAVITEQDLLAAIAECQGERHPNATTCIKLAAFYTIKQHLYPDEEAPPIRNAYSYASAPEQSTVMLSSGTQFADAVNGKPIAEIMPLMDEAMTLIQAAYPRLYEAVMDKLR